MPLLGKHRLDRLLPEHLNAAYQQMYDAGGSSSTVLKIHRILSRALTIAIHRDKIGRNVARLIDAPVADEHERVPDPARVRDLGHARVTTAERYTHIGLAPGPGRERAHRLG